MRLAFSVGVFLTETGIYLHWFSVFLRALYWCASGLGDRFSLLVCFDALPFIRWWRSRVDVRQPEFMTRTKISIACVATLCDFDETQRFAFTNCRRDGVTIDSIFDEVVVGHRQLSVIRSTVV